MLQQLVGKKMADRSVCTPQLAESDAKNNTTSPPQAASVTDADKVINTKLDSAQVEGDKREEELLKGLLTDEYCHVCEAVLLFESQRQSHYEGKKHAQKLRVYLQAKRAEKMNKESGSQRTMTSDKDHFCELCNMVFSSHVVARSHYEGKVHTKNLRKQGLQPPDRYTEVHTLPSLSQDPGHAASEGGTEHVLDTTAATTTPSTEVDLKDPDKYCALCAASFNNPQMALQHYNGRKHQRNQSKQELLRELGDDAQQADSLMCQVCSVQFNSVENYQAHMQGNKHQTREKKVIDLCKSQQKVYNTFADELSDYIQLQKVRGIIPKTGQVLPQDDTQKEDKEDHEEEGVEETLNKGTVIGLKKTVPPFSPTSNPAHHSHPGSYNPVKGWRPSYQGPPLPSYGLDYNCHPPVLPGSGSPLFTSWPVKRRKHRKQSSSSSYSTSSSYSSYSFSNSSTTSDSGDTECRHREKRKVRRSRRARDKRARDEDLDIKEKKRKHQRREREKESEERRRVESGDSEDDRRKKRQKNHAKRRKRDKKYHEEDFEAVGGERVTDNLMPKDIMDSRKETEMHIEAEIHVEQGDGGKDEPAKSKYRKDKKKTKEKIDTRTEEEKLWDDSILGC